MSDSNCAKCKDGIIERKERIDLINKDFVVTEFCDCALGIQKKAEDEQRILEEKKNNEMIVSEEIKEKMDNHVRAGFGEIYLNARISDFNFKLCHEELKKSIHDKSWLYITGKSRQGKTYLASSIYRMIGGTIIKAIELNMLMSYYGVERREEQIKKIATAPILFIDDIGVGKLTPERDSMYYYIIENRIANNLKTVFTSNHPTSKLWGGDLDLDAVRIINRIQEASKGFEVKKENDQRVIYFLPPKDAK